jgi:acetyltransferase-like isoleucine patch superfamily enzyme
VTVKADCWIGMGVCILPGVTIGEGCIVGAGAIVAKDLEPWSLAVGNPARAIRNRRAAPA